LVLLWVLQVFGEEIGFDFLGDLVPIVVVFPTFVWRAFVEHYTLQNFDSVADHAQVSL
jgi:hypothetical protein